MCVCVCERERERERERFRIAVETIRAQGTAALDLNQRLVALDAKHTRARAHTHTGNNAV